MNTLFIITIICVVCDLAFGLAQKISAEFMTDLDKYRISMGLQDFPKSIWIFGLLRFFR